ncbi:metallophosphoesterase [Castellaniella sp. S9]|uniref:metallophosphoesterase n=1 Tax=Castellaniella sp. S9 TaxID=2993652 RepID=UPI0022B5C6F3|nr:metallophosphoesterase [Castellaniella sp. S9]
MNDTLLQTIPEEPLAIIGDIHGEITALNALLDQLEQDPGPGRRLVFIGDLCDRGPDSIAVIDRVRSLIEDGKALAILGNHEINLLANDAKDGSGWYFDARELPDRPFYAPFTRATPEQRPAIREFFAGLPLALQSPSLRIVHAAWDPPSIDAIADVQRGRLVDAMHHWNERVRAAAQVDGLYERYLEEKSRWAAQLEDPDNPPPYLHAVADYEMLEQRLNPVKRLTSGIEERSTTPFYSGNRWRYSDRTAWWNDYEGTQPVVIGHYWRMFDLPPRAKASRYSLLFDGVAPTAWHGRGQRVFCVDYSAGARWRERKANGSAGRTRFRLAALLWPERCLVYDNGDRHPTLGPA